LDIAPDCVDVLAFESLVGMSGREPGRRAQLTRALELWDGEPYEDLGDVPFVIPERVRLDELRRVILQEVIDMDLAAGMHETLVPELEGLVARYPYAEGFWRALMLALYRSGRPADALAAFQRVRGVLGDDLGLEPGQALLALEDAIYRQDPELLGALSARLPRLPRPPQELIGRSVDVDALMDLVGSSRLVTVVGPAGVGKTRLALEVAALMAERFPGGVSMIELADVRDASLVVPEVARALDLTGEDPFVAITTLCDRAPTLLLLDNFEQIIDAGVDVARLLAASDHLHLLVTSRSPLRINAEKLYPLAPLASDEAVEFFMTRARAHRPDFTSESIAAEIVGKLDGLPLAIELAAASLRTQPVPDVLGGLSDRLASLRGGANDLHQRQRALASALEWSCDLLPTEARRLFAELCVFASPFRPESAVAVCPWVEDVGQSLGALVDASLIMIEDDRYRMLETVREFGHSLLEELGDVPLLEARHGEWILSYAVRARDILHSDRELEALAELERIIPDIRAAIAHFVSEDKGEPAAQILLNTGNVWLNGPLIVEFAGHLDVVAEKGLEGRLGAEVQAARGSLADSFGDTARAVELMEGAVARLRVLAPESVPLMNALCHLSAIGAEAGQSKSAVELAEEAIEVARLTGDPASVVMALDNAGYVARTLGDDARSLIAAEEAVELGRVQGSVNLAYALAGLARSLDAVGRTDDAVRVAEEAVVVADGANTTAQRAAVLTDVGPILGRARPTFAATRLVDAITDHVAMGLLPDTLSSAAALADLVAAQCPREAALLAGAVAFRTGAPIRPELESDLVRLLGESYDELVESGSRLDLDGIARVAGDTLKVLESSSRD
jgi:predicted ATPase